MQGKHGFTLIELMVVMAIVGILAGIAVPMYQDYLIRTKISEGLGIVSAAKAGVNEYYQSSLTWPSTNDQAGLSTIVRSVYVSSLSIAPNGVIVITFNPLTSGLPTGNNVLILTPRMGQGALLWTCGGNGTTIENKFLPSNCRS